MTDWKHFKDGWWNKKSNATIYHDAGMKPLGRLENIWWRLRGRTVNTFIDGENNILFNLQKGRNYYEGKGFTVKHLHNVLIIDIDDFLKAPNLFVEEVRKVVGER